MPTQPPLEETLEALLFASPEPLTPAEIGQVVPEVSAPEVERALGALVERYASPGGGLRILATAGGYRMTTRPEFAPALARLFQARNRSRLSQAALETLAIVAYRQPITGPEIQEIRGVNSQAVLRNLLERKLVRILGRKPVVGKPLLYASTREFLIHFGLNTLADLPQVEELQEVLPSGVAAPAEGAEQAEAAPLAEASVEQAGMAEAADADA